MKYFRVTYLPQGKRDEEWIMFQAASIGSLKKFFTAGSITDIKEVTKEEYDEYLE